MYKYGGKLTKYNKDYYDELPSAVCEMMDRFIDRYSNEEWFQTAWDEYRQHVLNTNDDEKRMPGHVFKNYIKHSLYHHGIKGQRWGVRRYQNEDGSLTPEGQRYYAKKDEKFIKKRSGKIYDKAMKDSTKEMRKFVKTELADDSGATAVNKFNKKLAEVMRTKTKNIRSPSGKVIEWVAKRGEVGVFMALADQGYDMEQLKQGVWATGRTAYRTTTVDMHERK